MTKAQEVLISFLLGIIAGCSIVFWIFHVNYARLAFYGFCLVVFHFLEYYFIARAIPDPSVEGILASHCSLVAIALLDFLINHSVEYWTAITGSILEHLVFHQYPSNVGVKLTGSALAPSSDNFNKGLGILLILSGQVIRSLAMLHAGSNFTHLIAETKAATHQLCTSGIYR